MPEYAIELTKVSKYFSRTDSPISRLKLILKNLLGLGESLARKDKKDFFYALDSIDLKIEKGEAFGIMGRNGAGKSTLLQIIAKTLSPSSGEVKVNGRINALLELGSGFNPEFTGRENVYLNGTVLGFSKTEIDERFESIVAFSEIGEFIDQPVKHYSSGMLIRLAFSVQAMLEPDILIVDEALAVGDIFFVQKCHDKIEQLLKRRQTTFVFVTHDLLSIQKYCLRAMVLDHGQCKFIGDSIQAVYEFQNIESGIAEETTETAVEQKTNELRNSISLGDMKKIGRKDIASLEYVNIYDSSGKTNLVFFSGDTITFHYKFRILKENLTPLFGIEIINSRNVLIYAVNNFVAEQTLDLPEKVYSGQIVSVKQKITLPLEPGQYLFAIGFSTVDNHYYQKKNEMTANEINSTPTESVRFINLPPISVGIPKASKHTPFYGLFHLPNEFEVEIS